jgi:hypothetical protein
LHAKSVVLRERDSKGGGGKNIFFIMKKESFKSLNLVVEKLCTLINLIFFLEYNGQGLVLFYFLQVSKVKNW